MRILAVIPARAGSKGIPNKNIRIINDHPLVYYAIHNAIVSENITDIVVSTDSSDVKIIAEQMGVKVKWRDAALCGDAVTLDSVIFDAIPREESYDYIVTMQPTSPTLKASTLDSAIEYAVQNDIDTVISVINAPRLSWGVKDGKKVPNYKERLNRQYMPPHYLETGAFVVSKAGIVTAKTRIGPKVDVFEVSEDEAVDVDTFDDLRTVSEILSKKTIAIYTDGKAASGLNRVDRALELADEFFLKPDIFYNSTNTDQNLFRQTTHRLIPVSDSKELLELCRANQYSVFINDIGSASSAYMSDLRKVLPTAKIVNFDDGYDGSGLADLVINPMSCYEERPGKYTGEKYYFAEKPFAFYPPITVAEHCRSILILLEGIEDCAGTLLQTISGPEYSQYHFTVVTGSDCSAEMLRLQNKYGNIDVKGDRSNIHELMSHCDLAVASTGLSEYELAYLGIPAIIISSEYPEGRCRCMAEDCGFSYICYQSLKTGFGNCLRSNLELPQEERKLIQDRLLNHGLRGGRRRVVSLINSL